MLYYKATTGCGVRGFVGVSVRKRTAPASLTQSWLGRAGDNTQNTHVCVLIAL